MDKDITCINPGTSDDPWILAQEINKTNIFFYSMVYYMINWWPKYNLSDHTTVYISKFEGQHVKMYYKQSEYHDSARFVADKILRNPAWALRQLNKIASLSDKFMQNSNRLVKISTGNREPSMRKLSEQFKKTSKYNLESQVLGAAFTWLTEARFEFVTKRVVKVIEEQIRKNKLSLNPIIVFNVLTRSEKKSHSSNEEKDFFDIIQRIRSSKRAIAIFKKSDTDALTKYVMEMPSSINTAIMDLYDNWCWLSYGYTGPEKSLKTYVEDIKKAIESNINPKSIVRKHKQDQSRLISEKKKMFKKLKFSKKQLDLINFVKESSFIKDYRKGAVYHGMYCYKKFFDSISKTFEMESDQFWSMTPSEIENLLESGIRVVPQELKNRSIDCVEIYAKNNVKFLFNEDARKILDGMIFECNTTEDSELKGTPVCMGMVRGHAKIIDSVDDMGKMEKGDILISQITYPNLLPAMKKASAIVTNVGGVICHAAIIARELNIPCIVGTKFATKKIRDGDYIEVDANNGIVKILDIKN